MKVLRGGWSSAGVVVAAVALLAAALGLSDFPGRDFISQALGPIASVSDASSDDAAGDALIPGDNGERFLPVPPPLDDDRVVAAISPLAKLSCHRDDPIEVPSSATSAATADALDAPLASYPDNVRQKATEPLLAAAVAPLTPVAAPSGSSVAERAANDMPADCPELLRYRFNRLQTGEPQSLIRYRLQPHRISRAAR